MWRRASSQVWARVLNGGGNILSPACLGVGRFKFILGSTTNPFLPARVKARGRAVDLSKAWTKGGWQGVGTPSYASDGLGIFKGVSQGVFSTCKINVSG